MWWSLAVGYVFSIAVGAVMLRALSNSLWRGLGWSGTHGRLRPYPFHPVMLGVIERAIYTASWQAGQPEFIAVWLTLKVAGQWSRWSDGEDIDGTKVPGRAVFNVFLIGNAVSIAYGAMGGLIACRVNVPILVGAFALVLGTAALVVWARRQEVAA